MPRRGTIADVTNMRSKPAMGDLPHDSGVTSHKDARLLGDPVLILLLRLNLGNSCLSLFSENTSGSVSMSSMFVTYRRYHFR
jgi:hypothetical protein